MKINLAKRLLVILPLLGLLAGCATNGNQGAVGNDVGTAYETQQGPLPGNALDQFNNGGGITPAKP